jgi:hypothetical protein
MQDAARGVITPAGVTFSEYVRRLIARDLRERGVTIPTPEVRAA